MSTSADHIAPSSSDAAIRAKLIKEGVIKWPKHTKTKQVMVRDLSAMEELLHFVDTRCGAQRVLEAVKRILCGERFLAVADQCEQHSREIELGPSEIVARALGIKTLALNLVSRLLAGDSRKLAAPVLKANGFYSCLKVDARNTP